MYYKHEEILYQKILRFQKKHKLSYRYSINNLAKDLNIKVVSYPTFDYNALNAISEDGFSVYENNKYYIFYNPFIIETRLNFTIAHEIGHIVLNHHKLVGKNILASGESGLIERQADIFAQNILMPAVDTYELLNVKSVPELAELYDVSNKMVEVRIKKLNYDLKWLKHVESKIFKNDRTYV